MLSVAHVGAGAAIGSFLPETSGGILAAFSLGIASHYLLDKVPHWEDWLGQEIHGYPSGTPLHKMSTLSIASGLFDAVVALIFFFFILRRNDIGPLVESPIFWAALGAVLPDILDNVPFLRNFFIKIPGVATERAFHERNHISESARRNVPYIAGLITQLIVVTISIWLLF